MSKDKGSKNIKKTQSTEIKKKTSDYQNGKNSASAIDTPSKNAKK